VVTSRAGGSVVHALTPLGEALTVSERIPPAG
jgi:hypothetical protein